MYKRLIEVDLPIRTISAHARREKSIRHGHISTLHIWWARRPLAACRAVLCAALWPDPADAECPLAFREAAARHITAFALKVVNDRNLAESCSPSDLCGAQFGLNFSHPTNCDRSQGCKKVRRKFGNGPVPHLRGRGRQS
jgi:adenine-specific DNA methylase